MAVADSVTLPGQPTAGLVSLLPLGGDGNSAPRSRYEVSAFELDGDASGGNCTMVINLDPVYESLVSVVSFIGASGAADAQILFAIVSRNGAGATVAAATAHLLAETNPMTGSNHAIWVPPPVLGATSVSLTCVNIDATETYFVNATILNFNKRASERVPLGVLLASLPRGTSSQDGATT